MGLTGGAGLFHLQGNVSRRLLALSGRNSRSCWSPLLGGTGRHRRNDAIARSGSQHAHTAIAPTAKCSPQSTIKHCDERAPTFARLQPLAPAAKYMLVAHRTTLR